MIRLIATDMDFTLLDDKGNVTERTSKALKAAAATGCRVTLASGRMLEAMSEFIRAVGVNAPLILYNGALIYDIQADKVISASPIPHDRAMEIIRWAEARGLYIQTYPGRDYFCPEVNDRTRAYAASIRVQARCANMPMSRWLEAHPDYDMQKLLIIDTPQGADAALEGLKQAFGQGLRFVKSKPHYVEITAEAADKGQALERLAAHLGIDRSEVMAFGDEQNDVNMLAWAGYGYAMANACPEALRAARFVAPRHTQDGVARVVEEYLEKGLLGP